MAIELKPHNEETHGKVTKGHTKVYLPEKIEIFERFAKTGGILKGTTNFEGYPIGQWAIQIRNAIKRENEGKGKGLINPTEEQLERLGELGILDRQIEATIDEKIEMLIQWREKHPFQNLECSPEDEGLKDNLKRDCSNEAEYHQEIEEYKKMYRYYKYIKVRKSQGKLTEEQIAKCKKGSIGEVLGFSTEVESVSEKYGMEEKYYGLEIKGIISKYGTMEAFLQAFVKGEVDDENYIHVARLCTINVIDIDKNPNSINYASLMHVLNEGRHDLLYSTKYYCFSSKRIDEVLETLDDREKIVIEKRFGLVTGKKETQSEIARLLDVSSALIGTIEKKAIRKLGYPSRWKRLDWNWEKVKNHRLLIEDERDIVFRLDKIITDIIIKNIDINDVDIEDLEACKEFMSKLEQREYEEEQREYEEEQRKREAKGLIGDLGLSNRTYNCLGEAGIKSLDDLTSYSVEEIKKIRGLGSKMYNEISEKLIQLGFSRTDDLDKDSYWEKTSEEETKESELGDILEEIQSEDSGREPTTQTENQEEKEELELVGMSKERLTMIAKNEEQIDKNDDEIKQELIQRILEQQKTIEEQQAQIQELKGSREGVANEQ